MYEYLVLGGTFDHFHAGHSAMITMAFSLSSHVVIGITTDAMVYEKEAVDTVQPLSLRTTELEKFLVKNQWMERAEIIPITDVYGTTREDTRLQAIVVTEQTQPGALRINEEREKRGRSLLKIHECPFVRDQAGEILSSTHIRLGKTNREGLVYASLFTKPITISEKARTQLRIPFGEQYSLLPSLPEGRVILVGDVITHSFVKEKRSFTSAFIDRYSRREPYTFTVSDAYVIINTHVENEPGTITPASATLVGESLIGNSNMIYSIQGEEDLLAVPAILFSPLGTRVVYGNPHGEKGIVVVTVNEAIKERVRALLAA
jgi:pantetheine-phosphate adenylyltransferase